MPPKKPPVPKLPVKRHKERPGPLPIPEVWAPSKVLTITEAALHAGVYRSTLLRAVQSGQCKGTFLDAPGLPHGVWHVRVGDLKAFLELERPHGVAIAYRAGHFERRRQKDAEAADVAALTHDAHRGTN